MGLVKKKNKEEKKGRTQNVHDLSAQLANARSDLDLRKQGAMERNNLCADIQREIDQISDECEILQGKNKKRWKRVWVLCVLFLLLGIGGNIAAFCFYHSAEESYAESLEQEYAAKREEIEQKLGEGQPQ
ncbi:MAG: hypothetical protein NC121_14155 [Blautia sp.]|nr:hypothetical protein [Blautia sp.]